MSLKKKILVSELMILGLVLIFSTGLASNQTQVPVSLNLLDCWDEYVNQGDECLAEGKFEEALKRYTQALEVNPGNKIALYHRAGAYLTTGDCEKALENNEKAVAIDPLDPMTYWHLADTYEAIGKHGKAIENWAKAMELLESQDEEVIKHYNQVYCKLWNGFSREEVKLATYFAMASTYEITGEYKKAIQFYKKLTKRYSGSPLAEMLEGAKRKSSDMLIIYHWSC